MAGAALRVEQAGDRTHRLVGELDIRTAPELLQAVEPTLRQGSGDLTLDLSELALVDSSGLSAFMTIARNLDEGRLYLVAPQPNVAQILALVRLELYPNIEIRAA